MINILIDGNYIFHKTFGIFGGYGPKNPAEVLGSKGEQAMFVRKISTDLCASLRLLPTGGRLIFTTDSRSWRKDVEIEDGGYKSNRVKDENVDWTIFFDLMQTFGKHLEKMGFVYSKVEGAEGDDLLYFWANHFNQQGENCIIISGDKDMHQLARWHGKNWTLVWNNNSKNNLVTVPIGWTSDWLNSKQEVSIFDMGTTLSPDKDKLKELVNKSVTEELSPRDFIFVKMLTGDKGDAVPSVWEMEITPGKINKVSPKKSEQVLESLRVSKWAGVEFQSLLTDEEFLDWISGFVLRLMKDVDSAGNRQKLSKNLLRNYTLMWLDWSVIPEWVRRNAEDDIQRGISLEKKSITYDRIKILEGTEWVTTNTAPKNFDPFANF
jgi:5'-3' exonuclease